VTHDGGEISVGAPTERIDIVEHDVDEEIRYIWIKRVVISELRVEKLVIIKNRPMKTKKNPIKYLATSKTDAPTEHVVRSYAIRWRVETVFEDPEPKPCFGDCEMHLKEGASRNRHLLIAAHSLVRLDPESNAPGTVRSKR
jgi:hypothetical protein